MSLASFAVELPSMTLAVAGKGALISLAALGAAVALRRTSAASRHLLLAFAAAALLLLPLFVVVLPSWDLPVLQARGPSEPHPFGPMEILPTVETPRGASPSEVPEGTQGSLRIHAASGDAPRGVSTVGGASPFLPWVPLAVSILLLIRLALAGYRLSALRGGSRPAPAEWQALLDRERRRLGIARSVRLAMSHSVAVPVTFGWRRPVVLLPAAALGWEEQPLREVLMHELSHVRRGDWPVQMMARAACALHWFDPLVWLLCRRLLLEAELACDDQVLQAGTGAAGYAERLVAMARQVRGAARRPAAAVSFARPSGLARRVSAILDSGRRRGGPGRLAMAGASVASLLLVLLVAPARLVRAEPERLQAVPQGVEEGTAGALDGADPMVDGVVDGVREALAEPASIREGIEGAAAPRREVLEEAVEQGVSGALSGEAIREGAREGVNEDSIRDGAREGGDEGNREREAAEAGDAAAAVVQWNVSLNTAVPGDGMPLTGPSREYARTLRRILTGVFFEPVVPGEGC